MNIYSKELHASPSFFKINPLQLDFNTLNSVEAALSVPPTMDAWYPFPRDESSL